MEDNHLAVLIVEDNPGDLRLVREHLGESCSPVFKTAHAGCLSKALELMANSSFDAILLDLNLPDGSGLGVLEKIVAASPETPVIVFTGQNDEALGMQALKKRAGDYLVKGQINASLLTRGIKYAIERKKREKELEVLNRALKARNDSSHAIMRATSEAACINEICRIIVEDCGHAMAWIGWAESDPEKTVRPVAQSGSDGESLQALSLTWADTERGRGATGTAIRTGKPVSCRNVLADPAFVTWRAEVPGRDYVSSLALPLVDDCGTLGALTIYSRKAGAFSKDEIKLLAEIADELVFGILAIRMRLEREKVDEILRRDNETFEKQVRERSNDLLDTQRELEKAKRLSDIGTLAAIVAHELRNPLAAINMAASNIRRKAANPLLEKHLYNIEKKVTESNQIISNLLFYSRIKIPQFETVDVAAILKECVNQGEDSEQITVPVQLKIEVAENTLIKADLLQMKEVFSNLLNNSRDAIASKPGGKIHIRATESGNTLDIIIKDTGVGIDKNVMVNIFEPFFTTKAKGTGLGLYVCQQILTLHGGAITVESELGKSTTVRVSLPRRSGNDAKEDINH